jgi:Site-specific recombinases, DNA invertase Pin homologs
VIIINSLSEKGVNFVSIKDNIDTNTITGRFLFGLFATLAQFEREIIIQRTHAGLQAARERGRIGGRKKGLSKEAKAKAKVAKQLYECGEMKIDLICKTLNIGSKATLYRYLKYTKTCLDKRT